MCRLLIADDEKFIRDSLLHEYDWEKHGIDDVSCCRNGLEVLDAMVDNAPDIVLADICMPGMNGLELLGRIHELDPTVVCVIMSGYCEFDYAKQAMAFGVRHYLTKPLDPDKLWAAIIDCQQIREQQQRYAFLNDFSQRFCNEESGKTADQSKGVVETLCDYAITHISDSGLTLKYIASHVLFMNVDYLSHLFVSKTGKRFSAYLNESRINLSKELLAHGDLNIHRVAELVGYGNNPPYFCHLFKKYAGMPPGEYQRRLKQ